MLIKLPFPPSELMPNRKNGHHWGSTNGVKVAANWGAHVLAREAMQKTGWAAPEGDIPLSIVFVMPDKLRRDVDNLLAASKAHLDGVAQALGVDDRRFKPILLDWVQGGKGQGATLISVGAKMQTTMEVL